MVIQALINIFLTKQQLRIDLQKPIMLNERFEHLLNDSHFQRRKNELLNYRHYKCIQVKMRQGISWGGLLSHTWVTRD